MAENLIISIELVNYTRSWDSLYIEDIYAVIEDVLKLKPSEHVEVIQKGVGHAPKCYKIGIKSEKIWIDHHLDSFIEEKVELGTGKTILIQKAYVQYAEVTVKNVPPHWDRDDVERICGYYGLIVSMTKETLRYSERRNAVRRGYAGIWNGNWRVKMKVNKQIPSTLIISDNKLEFHYRDQHKTCWRCGMDHQWKNCSTKYDDFINRFSLSKFPPLGSKRQEEEEEDTPEEDGPAEKHTGEKKDEEHTGEKKDEEHTGEEKDEEHTGENQDEQKENASEENHNGENDSDEDMEAIRPASPEQVIPSDSGNKVSVQMIDEFSDTEDKDCENNTIEVEVMHCDASQNVKGALGSPMHVDEDVTETASEGEIVMEMGEEDKGEISQPMSSLASGITPGQKESVLQDEGVGSQPPSLVAESVEILVSQTSESLASGVTPGQREQSKMKDSVEMMVSQTPETQEVVWTIVGGKRKDCTTSTDEENDNTVKASFGSFASSIISTGNTKKMKEFRADGKEDNM